ncbi:hypothetical protein BD413DRAFT_439343, partial [Trametes elegans]
TAPATKATPPFDSIDSADLTLRTSDCVDFQVHKAILAMVSPVFADMLALAQPPAGADARPVVDVSEDSGTLDALLRLCYPVAKPAPRGVHEVVPALAAAVKYDMAWPESVLREQLAQLAAQSPLQSWAIASRRGYEDVARIAAVALLRLTYTLTRPDLRKLVEKSGVSVPVFLEGVSAGDYFRLDKYLGSRSRDVSFLSPGPDVTPAEEPPQVSAPHAFTTDIPFPDVVCEAADGTQFLAHRAILSLHSPLLKACLSPAPRNVNPVLPPVAPSESLPEVRSKLTFDMESQTLSAILTIAYGGEDGIPADLTLLTATISACDKYKMASARSTAERLWRASATASPLSAYFVALHQESVPQAQAAAELVLRAPLKGRYVPLMEDAPSLAYHRLVTYFSKYTDVVKERL